MVCKTTPSQISQNNPKPYLAVTLGPIIHSPLPKPIPKAIAEVPNTLVKYVFADIVGMLKTSSGDGNLSTTSIGLTPKVVVDEDSSFRGIPYPLMKRDL
ncbi:MAG: hypothetical protein RMH77_00380 [Sulfolobales archaeon]|nr:hypothetical protein [Sulfolobales archaeon]